ncbi:hypothetical protein IM792_21075 [Mucilaginibacter sp. JRF]|uniref:hypothetical protein n=1 Tax=Mucilaginibacter sp. JRF TaxID=2780088 RepID=UPI001880D655|nr:hypothetical protein [Mucilaginibacter sp. JRF]MBE9586954.1 hypothetical protein [Mucilaginibacter sp. JRF]
MGKHFLKLLLKPLNESSKALFLRMKNLIANIVFTTFLILITSCQFDPYAGELTTDKPKREDVIGVYQFEGQTIFEVSIDKLGQNATIVLRPDSTYQVNNIPNVFGGMDDEEKKHISAKGNWKIETIRTVENRWGSLEKVWGITLTNIDQILTNISFTGDKAPYGLMIIVDDPTLGQMMSFQKKR